MVLSPRGIRKAAILVSSIDQKSADRLLEQMEPQQAQRVRQAVFELGDVDPAEQKQIIEEFRRRGPMIPQKQHPGVELDATLAQRISGDEASSSPAANRVAEESQPFRFLYQAENDKLAKLLIAERPQTIALVLAHLAPEQASAVLARFAPALQVEILRRLVSLEETAPDILHEVERALESRLSEQVHMQRRRVAGLSAVSAILEASTQRVGMQILDNLTIHDHSLAEKLGPAHVEFSDLESLDDRGLQAVLREAEPEVVELALVGASPSLVDRALRLLPEADAQHVEQQLARPGPTRLRDVEEARLRLAEVARRLAFARRIDLGRGGKSATRVRERIRVAA